MGDSRPAAPDILSAELQKGAFAEKEHDTVTSSLCAEWEACYRAEMPQLVRYLMKCFGEADMRDAADAAQSAFAELFAQWGTVRSPRAWLRTVAFRQMLHQPRECPLDAHAGPSVLPASSAAELREEEQRVLAALRQLSLTQRQALALVYDQFSYREIAEILGKSEATVRKSIERARAAMKEVLGVTVTAESRKRCASGQGGERNDG